MKTVGLRQENESLKDLVIDRISITPYSATAVPWMRVLRLIQKVEKSNIMVLGNRTEWNRKGTRREVDSLPHGPGSHPSRSTWGAIPADLIESELFGHEKGAFTDARERRIGKFEEATKARSSWTRSAKWICSCRPSCCVLQEKEVTRIGSNKSIKLDVRVVAATNRNLAHEVKEGKFREDLYYRLSGFSSTLPAGTR